MNRILDRPAQFDMDVQAQIPIALVAVHNFIREHDPEEIADFKDILEDLPNLNDFGDLAEGPATRQERAQADLTRDGIAREMWEDYQAYLAEM